MVKTSRSWLPAIGLLPFLAVLGLIGTLGWLLSDDCQDEDAVDILGEHQSPVHCLAFAPDGKTLASGGGFPGREGELRLWDLQTPALRALLRGHRKSIYAASFSPDGRSLATTSFDGMVKLWAMAGVRQPARVTLSPHYSGLPVAFSADGQIVALTGCVPGVAIPDCEQGEVLLWRRIPAASERALMARSVPFAVGADGRRLALCRLDLGPESAEHRPDGQGFPLADEVGNWPIEDAWDIAIGQQVFTLSGHEDHVSSLAFSPDGQILASASWDKTVRLWEAATGRELAILRGHTAQVKGVAFAADGRLLASASHDRTVRLWDVARRWEKAVLSGHEGAVTCVAFDPGGQWVASGSYDKTVRLWRLRKDS